MGINKSKGIEYELKRVEIRRGLEKGYFYIPDIASISHNSQKWENLHSELYGMGKLTSGLKNIDSDFECYILCDLVLGDFTRYGIVSAIQTGEKSFDMKLVSLHYNRTDAELELKKLDNAAVSEKPFKKITKDRLRFN